MKLCIDCRFAELIADVWMCSHPTSVFVHERSPVTGETPAPEQLRCKQARWFWSGDYCDKDGKYWEAREPRGFS